MADVGSLLGGLGIGGNIGKAIVQLELDTKKYTAEMEAAKAKTSASTSSLGSAFTKFGGVAGAAFTAVGVAAVAGLGLSVKAALEAQEAQQRLHNTIENAPQLAASAEKAFLDQAEAIRSVTGADDEAIVSGQALLGNMGLTEDAIRKLTPRVVDLAAKYDIDLQSAFKAVGKAATGSTGTLARYVGTVEKGATPAETLSNVLRKLGGAAGFAAQQAQNEPWRIISSDFEELAEDVGAALLPALKSLAEGLHDLMPVLKLLGVAIADIIKLAGDLAQALTFSGNGFDAWAGQVQAITNQFNSGKIGIVEYQKKLVDLKNQTGFNLDVGEDYLALLHDQQSALRQNAVRGAFMADRLKDVGKATKKAADEFKYADVTLDALADSTQLSERAFDKYFRTINRQSRELRQVARELHGEKWVNQDFIDFLSTKGPEWLIRFGDKTEEQQRRVQTSWERTNERTKKANENLGNIQATLDGLDKSNTRHTVEIHYKYVGFDPSKPGMASASSSGGQQ